MKNRMSDLKSARKITKAMKFLRYAYVFLKKMMRMKYCVTRGTMLRVGQIYMS